MKAHWLDGDNMVIVTGTLDPNEALAFLHAEAHKPGRKPYEGDVMDKWLRAEEMFAKSERGYTVPVADVFDDHSWAWRRDENGRCKAVIFE